MRAWRAIPPVAPMPSSHLKDGLSKTSDSAISWPGLCNKIGTYSNVQMITIFASTGDQAAAKKRRCALSKDPKTAERP